MYSCESHRKQVDIEEVIEFEDPTFAYHANDNCNEFIEFADIILTMKGMSNARKPQSPKDALKLYFILLEAINEHM